jgi:methyl-accepting chemotaxis protein
VKIFTRTVIAFFYFSFFVLFFAYLTWEYNSDMEKMMTSSDFNMISRRTLSYRNTVPIFSAIFFISTILDYIFIQQRDVEALSEIKRVISHLKAKDISVEIDPFVLDRKDEFGDLARALERTLVSLKLSMEERD